MAACTNPWCKDDSALLAYTDAPESGLSPQRISNSPCTGSARRACKVIGISKIGIFCAAIACAITGFRWASVFRERTTRPERDEIVLDVVEQCTDTHGWTDGWRHCAYERDGTDNSLCEPDPGALWPTTRGWTCKAYEQKGWCQNASLLKGKEAGRSRPEVNCCACGGGARVSPKLPGLAATTDQCSMDTGGTCSFFGHCDASRGSTVCYRGKCLCQPDFCTNADGRCDKKLAVSTTPMVTDEVSDALGLEKMSETMMCQNTPSWTDGWMHCAYEQDGKRAELCQLTSRGAWPSTSGWTCEAYKLKGWCAKGRLHASRISARAGRNYPDQNCCVCGGGKNIANPARVGLSVVAECAVITGGTCALTRRCDSFRGPAECKYGKCVCPDGFCADAAGTCQPRPETTPPPVDSAVRDALGIKVSSSGGICQDVPGWTSDWALCAYADGGRDPELCQPTPGAFWPSTQGWTCRAYEEKGWCGERNQQNLGVSHNYPEHHCCACGGGRAILKGAKAKTSPNKRSICYKDTGGTCHILGRCAGFRGEAACVEGRCVCKPGHCTDASGTCRVDAGVFTAAVAPVSHQHPIFPGRQAGIKTALCVSGGGFRSLAATLGYFRALHELGLLNNFDMLSSVSGGTWASAIYMFSDVSHSELLGPSADPGSLTLDVLRAQPAKLGSVALSSTNRIIVKLLPSGLPYHMLWIQAIAEAVLKPFRLDSLDAYMAPDVETVRRIIARNPQLKHEDFLLPRESRPRTFVMSGTVEAPDGYKASDKNVAPLQMSPDFSGTPFVPNDEPVSYKATPGTHRPPLNHVVIGGGLVETFAFGGQEPSDGQSGGADVRLEAPPAPFSLARAVGISSAAFGAAASRAGFAGVAAGAKLDPQVNLWPVTSTRHPGPLPAITYQLGDGSNLDNMGLIAALQRGATRMFSLVNADVAFKPDARFCASSGWPSPDGSVTKQLLDKFGYADAGGSMGFFGHNQVFAQQDLFPLLCDFTKLNREGRPLIAKRSLVVQKNDWWGLRGGTEVEVAFALLSPSTAFEAALPPETQSEILRGDAGEFARFPNYRTVFQNSDLTSLSSPQVNLIAALSEFAVKENAEMIRELFS